MGQLGGCSGVGRPTQLVLEGTRWCRSHVAVGKLVGTKEASADLVHLILVD